MNKATINSFEHYLTLVGTLAANEGIILYRGQSGNDPLLPSAVRKNPSKNSTNVEKAMLDELKRRAQLKVTTTFHDDWDWLVYAQHFGMKTRLLDWTSNPLIGLWFACSNEYKIKDDSFVYIFVADNTYLIDRKKTPFETTKTRILRPALNNERIIAQAGWFTAHKYSHSQNKFVSLQSNNDLKNNILEYTIPAKLKPSILKTLSVFGVNYQTLFPDVIGVCNHLNWMYSDKLK
jgi:hypothetical protein